MKPYNIRWRKEIRQKSALFRLEKDIKKYSKPEHEEKLARATICLRALKEKLNQ
jgi:hypothetical protein